MTITVPDTSSAIARILDASPGERTELVREMWQPMSDMYGFIPGGVDLAAVHAQSFGFDVHGEASRLRDGLRELVDADAWARTERALTDSAHTIASSAGIPHLPDLTALIVLGDPDDTHFIDEVQGLSAFGGISGYISLTLWPLRRVLDRIEAIAAHELHHNVRYSPGGVVWDPATVTLGEQIVAEGLADVFAIEQYGPSGLTHFVVDQVRDDDEVLAKITGALGITGMQDFAAWVLGDSTARRFGTTPQGVPTGAGYAVGVRLVREFLDSVGGTAAQHVHTPAADIIDVARGRLGLHG